MKKSNHHVNIAISNSREACFGFEDGDHGTKDQNLWYLDSGATSHMTHNSKNIIQLDANRKHTISLGHRYLEVIKNVARSNLASGILLKECDVGPMETATLSGNRYYMVSLDDFSNYCIVYLLKY